MRMMIWFGTVSDIRLAIRIGSMNEVVPTFLQNGEGTVLVSLEAREVQCCVAVLVHVVHLQVFRGDRGSQ